MLTLELALRDLWRDRVFFLCNLAILMGVLVPLLVLFGVKNGVYEALVGRLMSDPATLQIDTRGNAALTEADVAPLAGWPEVAFAVPRVRSQFDYVDLQKTGGGRILRQAVLLPTGAGDPNLPPGVVPGPQEVVLSALVARQLQAGPGDALELATQAEDRPRQLVLPVTVLAVLPESTIAGRAVLAPYATLDLFEAFYDAYALPDHGITEGKPLSTRQPRFEGLRLYARNLEGVALLQARVEATLGLATEARTREIEAVLGLGRNLDIAMALTTALAALGMAAALIFGFWADVARKGPGLAALAILGLGPGSLALLPLVQAGVTALVGIALAFATYLAVAGWAQSLFGAGLPPGARIAVIAPPQALTIAASVLALVLGAASAAAWAAQGTDPARVLREGK